MHQVQILDTTLRDGEQTPGISLSIEEKIKIAHQLARLGVDVIEAGFPITSEGDFESVSRIADEVQGPTIAGVARICEVDIERAWRAVRWSRKPRIHTFIGTSDLHLEHQLHSEQKDILSRTYEWVCFAKSLCPEVEFSPMDATRTEIGYLAEVVRVAIDAGADIINIPDTVGYSYPEEFAALLMKLQDRVPELERRVLSVHCHNDLGLAVANSLAGVSVGAGQIEVAVNGIGERAGNASLEESVMAIVTREDYYQARVGIKTRQLSYVSHLVSEASGCEVSPNKAIVGRNAFAHESGIHQDGVLKDCRTFEIMKPQDVGQKSNCIFLGKTSGRHALKKAFEEMGHNLESERFEEAFKQFKEVADRKKKVTAKDLDSIVADQADQFSDKLTLEFYRVIAVSDRQSRASVSVSSAEHGICESQAEGEGPVDALLRAIDQAAGIEGYLTELRTDVVNDNGSVVSEARVAVEFEGHVYSGRGLAQNVVEGAVKAYLQAANTYTSENTKVLPPTPHR